MKKKNILLVLPTPFYSPLSLNNYTRARAIIELSHKVDILTFPHGDEIDFDNVQIIRYPKIKIFKKLGNGEYVKILIYLFLMFLKMVFLKKGKYDYIFTFGPSYLFTWIFKPFLKNVKIIATVYTRLDDELIKWDISSSKFLYKLIQVIDVCSLKKHDFIIMQTSQLINDYKNFGIQKDKLVLICQSFIKHEPANHNFIFSDYDNDLFEKYFVVIYAGSFVEVQNIQLIYETAVLLKNKKIRFLLIGATDNDLEKENIKIDKYKVHKTVKILPRMTPDLLNEYMKRANILISPRIFGYDTPLKIFDYLSQGKCILAADKPIHNHVLNKKVAHLIEPEPEKIAESIIDLKNNPNKVKNYGESARQYFEDNFSFEKMIQCYEELFNEINI